MGWGDKMSIHIRGCLAGKWPANYSECLDTWGKVMSKDGWRIKVVLGHPELDTLYKESRDFFFVRTTDGKNGVFEKTIYASCKWLVEQDDHEWVFITDSDTFVHPTRFIETLDYLYEKYGDDFDYIGAARPVWYGINEPNDMRVDLNHVGLRNYIGDYLIKRVGGIYLSGGSGFIMSKKAAAVVVDAWESGEYVNYPTWKEDFRYYDDCLTGLMMSNAEIKAIHSNAFQSTSPQNCDIPGGPPFGIETREGSFIAVQHYQYGQMKRLMKELGID